MINGSIYSFIHSFTWACKSVTDTDIEASLNDHQRAPSPEFWLSTCHYISHNATANLNTWHL